MSAGKADVRRTGSMPEVFSVMCCNGLVPVVLVLCALELLAS